MQTPLEPLSSAGIGMQSISHTFYHLHGCLRSVDESEAFTYWTSRYLFRAELFCLKITSQAPQNSSIMHI